MTTATEAPSEFQARVVAAQDGDLGTYAQAVHERTYYQYQDVWALALESYNEAVIVCPPDTYKSLDLETQIPTPTGWRRFGDLQVGDEVFDEHGKPTSIVGVSPTWGDRSCYNVRFGDGTSIVADAEHLWLTRTRKDLDDRLADEKTERRAVAALLRGSTDSRIGTHQPRTRTPNGSVKTTEELSTTVRIPYRGGWNHHVPVTEAVEYPEAHLTIAPYTLGAWLGDGHSANGRITNTDSEVWDSIVIDGYKLSEHELTRTVYGLHPELRELGILNNKHIPERYLHAPAESRWELLQGLMDTDGSPGKSGCVFVNTNRRLAYGMLELARSLGLVASIHEYEATLNGVYVGQKWHVTFPTDQDVFRIRRKQQALDKPGPKRQGKPIVAVTSVAARPVRCISVANSTGLFLAGEGFTPTHNSTTVRDYVEREIGRNPNIRILWLMNAGAQSTKQIMAVQQTLEFNNVYKAAYDVREDGKAQWTKEVLYVERTREGADPTLMGTGMNGPYQGLHFDIIIIDDPTEQEDPHSPTTMEMQRNKVRGVIHDRLVEGGRIVVILTRWGDNDLVPTFADMGFCLAPWTKVLKSDLSWVDIGSLVVGDDLIGIDEFPLGNRQRRKMRKSKVLSVRDLTLPCYKIVFEGGREVVASAEHPWLRTNRHGRHNRSKDWVVTKDLTPGEEIRDLGVPWSFDESREAGYLAGFLDSDGFISRSGGWVGLSQNPGVALETVTHAALDVGFEFVPNGFQDRECHNYKIEDPSKRLALIGSIRPSRLLERAGDLWNGVEPPIGRNGQARANGCRVKAVDYVGPCETVGITTSENTFVAEGLFTHNTIIEMPIVGDYPWGPTLDPVRFTEEWIENKRKKKGDILFALTFMLSAEAAAGNLVLREHIRYWDKDTLPTTALNLYVGVDPAASVRTYADHSAIATIGLDIKTKIKYLVDMWCGRLETPDLEKEIVNRAKRMVGLRGVGLETKGFQLSLLQGMRRRYNLPFVEIPYRTRRTEMYRIKAIDDNKVGRAMYLDAQFSSGLLLIPKSLPLVDGISLESELCSIPHGKMDDRMDALAIASILAEAAVPTGMSVRLRGF